MGRAVDPDGTCRINRAYRAPDRLADFLTPAPDPFEATPPALELVDPSPAEARAAVSRRAEATLDADRRRDLLLATSEAVTNAVIHGTPPVIVRIWRAEGRVVVTVADRGRGPDDPLAGLVPGRNGAESGRGLWLAHQLDIDISLIPGGDAFKVRLRAGSGPSPV